MATKKRNYGGLTGGTGDVNQQTYTIQASAATTVGSAITQFPVPVPKFSSGIDKAIVMELLGVQWDLTLPPSPTVVSLDLESLNVNLTTNPTHQTVVNTMLQDPRSLSTFRRQWGNIGIPVTSVEWDLSEYDDLTDQAGHGILVAADNVYLDVISTATGYVQAGNIVARLFYRMKEVKLVEYIGIVQSQQ